MFAGSVLYNGKVHGFIFLRQESFHSAVHDVAQKDTRHSESLLKVKWLKGMARGCIIIPWKRAISSRDTFQLAKKAQLLPLRECKVGHLLTLRRER